MINTSMQLKALVRNRSGGDSIRAQYLIRTYMMERFLERLSISRYKEQFIIKGGILIASFIGLENRGTMDVDATFKGLTLSTDEVLTILNEIIKIPLQDRISFQIESIINIMDEAEYPGIRATLSSYLDTMKIPVKIDISTGDIITPREIEYKYPLLFENRTIPICTYNLETILAEKLETILSREISNTRLRDYYDIYVLWNEKQKNIDIIKLRQAIDATFVHRNSVSILKNPSDIVSKIYLDQSIQHRWKNYQQKYNYARPISWKDAILAVTSILSETSESLCN